MGCFWSNESFEDRCRECHRRKNYSGECYCTSRLPRTSIQRKPLFGKYRCYCGRTWESRCAWKQGYQLCNRCQKQVYPYEVRELRPGDIRLGVSKDQNHKKENCQMCLHLGRYCGTGFEQMARQRRSTAITTRAKRY